MIPFLAGLVAGAAVILVTLRLPAWWHRHRPQLEPEPPGWWPFDESAGWPRAEAERLLWRSRSRRVG